MLLSGDTKHQCATTFKNNEKTVRNNEKTASHNEKTVSHNHDHRYQP